jgi:hypothetical protein
MATITAPRRQNGKQPKKLAPKLRTALSHAGPADTETKTADNKGRVVLGGLFANRAVIIERLSKTELVIKLARVIPESEAWLYENPEALAAVRTGLAQARGGAVTQGPDVDADSKLAAELEG